MKNPLPLQIKQEQISPEATALLKVLDELETFTVNLRERLMLELNPKTAEDKNNL